jgi:hypothetical protein
VNQSLYFQIVAFFQLVLRNPERTLTLQKFKAKFVLTDIIHIFKNKFLFFKTVTSTNKNFIHFGPSQAQSQSRSYRSRELSQNRPLRHYYSYFFRFRQKFS